MAYRSACSRYRFASAITIDQAARDSQTGKVSLLYFQEGSSLLDALTC